MDENASRAVFVGVSVFVAIITITLILNFYRTAKDSAAVANRYDITNTGNQRIDQLLSRNQISGLELRYILNYFENGGEYKTIVYKSDTEKLNLDVADYWSEEHQTYLDNNIRPNYNYELTVDRRGTIDVIIAIFEY